MPSCRLALCLVVATACHSGERVAPAKVTYAQAVGGSGVGAPRCRAVGTTPSPLVVDADPADRVNLEVALGEGITAVAYDCQRLRILTECRAPGRYAFKGATRKEQVVALADADEIHANLPTGGAKLEAGLARGATLEVGLAMIGKLRASRAAVGKADLVGDCDGATHFIRGATVGAFAMTQGTRGEVKATAAIFADAASTSKRSIAQKDGELAACNAATVAAATPPEACGAILRLDLRALVPGTAPATQAPSVEVAACPEGMDLRDGKCAVRAASEPFQCELGDEATCKAQCDRGHAGSCTYAGGALMDKGELAGAAPYFAKGCAAGQLLACHNLGFAHYMGAGVPRDNDRAMALFRQVCDGGEAVGCAGVALLYAEGKVPNKSADDNDAQARTYYELACQGGDQLYGCPFLGQFHEQGRGGLKVDRDQARALYKAACDAGSSNGCLLLDRLK